MKPTPTLLPTKPSYDEACDIVDHTSDDFWSPVLQLICIQHQLPKENWIRIKQGANVLYKINESFIIKIVPPNWQYQALAEIESCQQLEGKLSISIPKLVASGTIDNWIYVVLTLLPGKPLAEVWDSISIEEKLPLVKQLGFFIQQLHKLNFKDHSLLQTQWDQYTQKLFKDCESRHKRKKLPEKLLLQIKDYLPNNLDYMNDGEDFFIHMDLHPWNLMVEEINGKLSISGVLDFGDAIIGRSRLLELNTPLIFLCQGSQKLTRALLDSYKLIDFTDVKKLQHHCMAVALLRPACDFNFVLTQVAETGLRENWKQIAEQLFPI